jgi:4-carboxymuconolactone decarboxylase
VGLSPAQLRQLIQGLEESGDTAGAVRARTALTQALAALNIRE